MQKLSVTIVAFLLFFGCKTKEEPAQEIAQETRFVSFQDMPDEPKMKQGVTEILESWPEFQELERSFQVMYLASNNEDLALAITDLLMKEKELSDSDYPELFDTPQIKSRQRVLRTFILKVDASLKQQTDVNEPIEQLFLANNAWRNQMNILFKDQLDVKKILDELP